MLKFAVLGVQLEVKPAEPSLKYFADGSWHKCKLTRAEAESLSNEIVELIQKKHYTEVK